MIRKIIFVSIAISYSALPVLASVQTYLPWFRVADVNASEMITASELKEKGCAIAFASRRKKHS